MNPINDDQWTSLIGPILDKPQLTYVTSLFKASGSLFVYSLFDDHPDLYTFPWPVDKYIDLINFDKTSWQEHLEKILQSTTFFDTSHRDVKTQGDGLNQLGVKQNQGIKTDKEQFHFFAQHIFQQKNPDRRRFTLGIILAFNFARNRIINSNKFILYTHDIGRTLECQRTLGAGMVIATSRHPASICVSIYKRSVQVALDSGTLPEPPELSSFRHFYEFIKLKHNRSLNIFLLEELHANPEQSLRALCTVLNIPFAPSLLQSTFGSLAWWGIRASTLHGFSPTLHRQLPLADLGTILENVIFQITKTFQCQAGYAKTMRVSRHDTLTFYLLDKMFFTYFTDLAKAYAALSKQKNIFEKCWLTAQFARQIVRHLVQTTRNYRLKIRLRRVDRKIPPETLAVVNPLQAQSIDLIR